MSSMVLDLSWCRVSAWARFLSSSSGRRPPLLPRPRAASSPALVRSRMRSRSNSARAAKTWKTSLPSLVVVSMLSWRLRNPIPRSRRAASVSTRWRSDRPRRSSFQTTTVSPLRAKLRACSRPVRSAPAPPAVSMKMRSHPALVRASFWRSNFWSAVETCGVADEHGHPPVAHGPETRSARQTPGL